MLDFDTDEQPCSYYDNKDRVGDPEDCEYNRCSVLVSTQGSRLSFHRQNGLEYTRYTGDRLRASSTTWSKRASGDRDISR